MEETKKLLEDFARYKTTNVTFHAGDVLEHSIWSALYTNHLFAINDPLVQGINPKFRKAVVVASLLHDIGKGGDGQYIFYEKPNHPEIGGYYFGQGFYPDPRIDLRKVVSELGERENYELIKFLVRWHWMIGGIYGQQSPKTEAWDLYADFNISCHIDKIPFEKRAEYFRMLYVVWVSDLLATQRYPYDIDPGMPLELSNPPANHKGNNMYEVYKVASKNDIREHVIRVFEMGYERPDFRDQIDLYSGYKTKIKGIYYNRFDKEGNPVLWKEMAVDINKLYPDTDIVVREQKEKCKRFLEHSDIMEIPLFQAFPELTELPKEKLIELYGIVCGVNYKYVCPMIRPIEEKFSGTDIVKLPKDTIVYHGRGYNTCEPPNIGILKPFWLFLEKKYAYVYAVGRDEKAVFPTKGYCWNVLSYKIARNCRLLNLDKQEVREYLRKALSEFMCEKWYITEGIMSDLDAEDEESKTYGDLIKYMFPSEKTRVSNTVADLNLAITLSKVFPNIDGWYIGEHKTFDPDTQKYGIIDPEIVIFKPYELVKLVEHDYFDAERLGGILDRCKQTKDEKICMKDITSMFKEGKIICLEYSEKVQCYLPDELSSLKMVTDQQYKKIESEVKKGNVIIKIV